MVRSVIARGAIMVALSACGESGSATIRVETTVPPAIVAFREEGVPSWKALATVNSSTYEIAVTGAYHLVVACKPIDDNGLAPAAYIMELAATPDDSPRIDFNCQANPFTVTGQLPQPGIVALGSSLDSVAGEPFVLEAHRGTFDLVALFHDPARIAIRRDLAITGDTELGLIDPVAENAQALVPVSFTASNVEPNESPFLYMQLFSGNTIAQLSLVVDMGTLDTVLAPESMLRATDRHVALLSASSLSGTRFREIRREVRAGGDTMLSLPPHMGPVHFDTTANRVAATWSVVPEYDELLLQYSGLSVNETVAFQSLRLTRAYIEATGTTIAVLDVTSVPGVNVNWQPVARTAGAGLKAVRVLGDHDFAVSGVEAD